MRNMKLFSIYKLSVLAGFPLPPPPPPPHAFALSHNADWRVVVVVLLGFCCGN
jgi:hypothetical protein